MHLYKCDNLAQMTELTESGRSVKPATAETNHCTYCDVIFTHPSSCLHISCGYSKNVADLCLCQLQCTCKCMCIYSGIKILLLCSYRYIKLIKQHVHIVAKLNDQDDDK